MQKQSLHIFKIGGSTHIPHVQVKKKKSCQYDTNYITLFMACKCSKVWADTQNLKEGEKKHMSTLCVSVLLNTWSNFIASRTEHGFLIHPQTLTRTWWTLDGMA